MPPSNQSPANESPIALKDPFVAAILAWLIPGLGHFYQRRNAKGALFAICIWGTFLYGLYLGGSSQLGWGRAVYYKFDEKEWRLPWLCQIGVGLPTLPLTLLQLKFRDDPLLHGFMAPPISDAQETENERERESGRGGPPKNFSLATIEKTLSHYFELGTVYAMIAGLLNIMAVYDACCGPVIMAVASKEDESDESPKDEEK